jgi:hypothetical protein
MTVTPKKYRPTRKISALTKSISLIADVNSASRRQQATRLSAALKEKAARRHRAAP